MGKRDSKETCRRQLEHFRQDSEGETQRDVEGNNELLTGSEREKKQGDVEMIGGLLTVGERRRDLRRHAGDSWSTSGETVKGRPKEMWRGSTTF